MLLLGALAFGQDLGSANKLFGGGTKKANTATKTTKKPSSKPKTTAKKSTSTPKATKSTVPAKKNTATKANAAGPAKKKIEVAKIKTAESKASSATNELFEDLIDKGNAARDDREYAAAEAAYKRAQALKPKDSRATYGLGNLYSDQQRWEEAETAYRNALEIDPSDAIAHIALSYVLTQPIAAPNLGDRYAEAERFARRAIQLDATNALGFDQLGVAMELRGLIGAETENAYRRAIQLDKTFAPAFAHLGRLLRRRGMAKESAAAYKNAVTLSTDVATMIVVAEVMQSELRFAESEPLLRSAIGGDPKNPAALLMLGRALTAQSKYYEAEQMLKRGLAASPNAFMPNSLLGSLFIRQGKLELAENALLQAVRHVSPYERRQLAQQFEAVGDGYRKTGRSINAERAYRQALALDVENRSVANKLPKSRPD
jgi:tetratricopeptide (TPR) repeat protein